MEARAHGKSYKKVSADEKNGMTVAALHGQSTKSIRRYLEKG